LLALFTRFSIRANGGGDIECLATGDIKAEDRKIQVDLRKEKLS